MMVGSLPQFAPDMGCPEFYRQRYIGGSMFCTRIDQCSADDAPETKAHTASPCAA